MQRTPLPFLRRLFLRSQGRPLAAGILGWFLLLGLLSEIDWPEQTKSSWWHSALNLFTPSLVNAREAMFDSYQKFYPRTPRSAPVTIVEIDEESLHQIGQFPWPRNRLAALIDAIAAHQPLVIGLDLYMPEEDKTSPHKVADNLPAGQERLAQALRALPTHETILANALRATPTVLAAVGFNFQTYDTTAGLRTRPVAVLGAGDPLQHLKNYPWVLASLPQLQAAASGQGLISLSSDGNQIRRLSLAMAVNGQPVPSLSMEMLRAALGATQIRLAMGPHGIQGMEVGEVNIPTQANGEIWLHYAHIANTRMRNVSAAKVLAGQVDSALLQNKLVLIGVTGQGLSDQKITTLHEQVAGVEMHAQTIESVVDGRLLSRPPWMKWLEITLVGLVGSALIYWIPRHQSVAAMRKLPLKVALLTVGIHVIFATCGFAGFVWGMVLFDPTLAFSAISTVMGSLVSSAWIKLNEEQKIEA